jgi:acyl transferase domain-containing protein
MVLEKGVIPPNTNFEKVNPKIDTQFLRIKVSGRVPLCRCCSWSVSLYLFVQFPQSALPWPTSGLRRASVNSFGYGGSNSHIVLDDAYNYLRLRGLRGKHRTAVMPPKVSSLVPGGPSGCLPVTGPTEKESDTGQLPPKLIVLSTADETGVGRIAEALQTWYMSNPEWYKSNPESTTDGLLDDLAYTLDSQRSRLAWKSFALLPSLEALTSLPSEISPPARDAAEAPPRLGFVFSGQGAQWFAMGRELLCYASFSAELEQAGRFLADLGCPWSPFGIVSPTALA